MRLHVAAAVVLGLAIGGCAQNPPPRIPITIDPISLTALRGQWTGSYRGDQTLRTGAIEFSLNASGDSATGSVVMTDERGMNVLRPVDTPQQHLRHAVSSQVLFIRFVGARDGEVFGKLEPYVAPDCDCTVNTSFTGKIRADTVSGTYFTEQTMGLTQTGTWKVVRRSIAADDK
jgi:hypothetical protein